MNARRTLAYYAAEAALCVLALAAVTPLRVHSLQIPVTYERDGLFLAILGKAIGEDGILHASRLGAPFGADIVDWPIGMWLPFAQMAALNRLLGQPGTALNLYWMSTIVVASLCATYAFRRLRLGPRLAFVLGILYGFQPYAFYRNVEHVNLSFPFVPLLALLCLRVAGTRPEDESRRERIVTLAACVAQGFSYVYYSVFAGMLLAAAAPLGWWRTRSLRLAARGALAIALLALCTTVTLVPSMLYWHRHGFNPDLDYKPPRETETYALKLRHLLVPIPEHPLPSFRTLADRVERARFQGENENTLSRLATLGSLGFLALLLLTIRRAAGIGAHDEDLGGAGALTLFALLVTLVGGLGSLFTLFVVPDVRGWARIVVFLSFFALFAAGSVLSRVLARLRRPWFERPGPATAAAAALLVCGLFDQVPVQYLWRIRAGTDAAFDEERDFVRSLESRLPAGAMVFQLPHMTVPVDRGTYPPMLYYDPGRAYFHSRTLRWGWGAILGRHQDWGRAVDALPASEKVRTLALAGFSAIWIDRWGYTGDPRPRYQEVEAQLGALAGEPLVASSRGRYSVVSLEPYRQRLVAEIGPERAAREKEELLADMPIAHWREGCGEETRTADGWSRRCGPAALLELRNWRPGAIDVSLAARLRAVARPARVVIRGPGFEDRVALAADGALPYARVFEIDGTDTGPVPLGHPRNGDLELRVEEPAGCSSVPPACFEIAGLSITTRRKIHGIPVNASGGVTTRTKY